jgi:phosphodiesterase/alkaline phosphatase D-like protein
MKQQLIALLLVLGVGLALSPSMMAQASAQGVQITNGPLIESADSSSAMIAWSTSQPSSSRVWYGKDANNLTQQAESPYATGNNHRVQLKNLEPSTTYYFQVESARGQAGPEAESPGVMSFKTPAQGQPTIHNQPAQVAQKGPAGGEENGKVKITNGPVLEEITSNSAKIAWSTNLKGSSRVTYGTDANNLTQLGESPWGQGGLTHRVQLKNLQPNTTYYFRVETGQAQGTGGAEVESNKVMSFKTPAQGATPIKNQQPQ